MQRDIYAFAIRFPDGWYNTGHIFSFKRIRTISWNSTPFHLISHPVAGS